MNYFRFRSVGILNEDFFRRFLMILNVFLAGLFFVGNVISMAAERSGLFAHCVGIGMEISSAKVTIAWEFKQTPWKLCRTYYVCSFGSRLVFFSRA